MQTFLPYPDYQKSAQVLDRARLGKMRVEAKQIYLALTDPSYGWKNHPAVKMWSGWQYNLDALAQYGWCICDEWRNRGYKDTLIGFFAERLNMSHKNWLLPPWLDKDFCRAHQSNLLRKDFTFYSKFFVDVPPDLPYIWPR
jgi:hypothetical protein